MSDNAIRLMKESPNLFSKQEGKYGMHGTLASKVMKVDQGALVRTQ